MGATLGDYLGLNESMGSKYVTAHELGLWPDCKRAVAEIPTINTAK